MKAIHTLPEGYKEFYTVDLQKNKKIALLVNLIAVVITVLLIIPACFVVPLSYLFRLDGDLILYCVKFAVLGVSMILYIILHELVHGIAMKICGTRKVKYGFTGMYAFAGSDDYYDKKSYIFIALAPIVFWGVLLAVINSLVSLEWFWVVYWIQIVNLSGAAGDLFVTFKFMKFPKDIVVKDIGVSMTVYSQNISD